jgi:peptidoglycan-associated lipoprotein
MHSIKVKAISLALAAVSLGFLSGCCELAYRQAIACQLGACHTPAPPVALSPEPAAVLASDRAVVILGESIKLTWHTEHATKVTIEPIGQVQPDGSSTVTPSGSTKYHLVAEGPGGVEVSTVWVFVKPPPDPAPLPASPGMGEPVLALKFFFDYDRYTIPPDQQQALDNDLQLLLQNPETTVVIEGYCDDRGSSGYNLTLAVERTVAVRQAFVQGGVGPDRIKRATFGKEKPVCVEHSENCYQGNRRVQFVQDQHPSSSLN